MSRSTSLIPAHRLTRSSFRAILAVVILIGAALPAGAATYRIPSDDALIGKSAVIVRGTVSDVRSLRDMNGAIVTEITVSVDKVLKGARVSSTIHVRQPGGTIGDESFVVPGIGSFDRHEEVLLMLDARPGGTYRLTDFALGKFHVGRASDGSRFLRRDGLDDARVVGSAVAGAAATAGAAGWTEPDRDADAFERFVEESVAGRTAAADYMLPSLATDAGASIDFAYLGSPASRRNEFDSGGVITYKDNASGDSGSKCPTGCHTEVAAGVVDWNAVPGAKISLAYGGTDSTVGSKCFQNLVNQIQFNDPCTEISDLTNCAGTLAIGGFGATGSGGISVPCSTDPNGPQNIPYNRITVGAIVVNNGVGSCENSCDYLDMIAHETGHTIGAGHSAVGSALMAPFLASGRCGATQPDDEDFAVCVYPQAGLTCSAGASPTSGRHPLNVGFNPHRLGGVAPFTFAWDFGDGGIDTAEFATHTYTAPGIFTASVTVMDANSQSCTDSIDIDVQPCLASDVTSVTPKFKGGLLKAVVLGSGFLKGTAVEIDAGSGFVAAPRTVKKSKRKVIGKDVEAIWPPGTPVMVRVVSATGCPSNAISATR